MDVKILIGVLLLCIYQSIGAPPDDASIPQQQTPNLNVPTTGQNPLVNPVRSNLKRPLSKEPEVILAAAASGSMVVVPNAQRAHRRKQNMNHIANQDKTEDEAEQKQRAEILIKEQQRKNLQDASLARCHKLMRGFVEFKDNSGHLQGGVVADCRITTCAVVEFQIVQESNQQKTWVRSDRIGAAISRSYQILYKEKANLQEECDEKVKSLTLQLNKQFDASTCEGPVRMRISGLERELRRLNNENFDLKDEKIECEGKVKRLQCTVIKKQEKYNVLEKEKLDAQKIHNLREKETSEEKNKYFCMTARLEREKRVLEEEKHRLESEMATLLEELEELRKMYLPDTTFSYRPISKSDADSYIHIFSAQSLKQEDLQKCQLHVDTRPIPITSEHSNKMNNDYSKSLNSLIENFDKYNPLPGQELLNRVRGHFGFPGAHRQVYALFIEKDLLEMAKEGKLTMSAVLKIMAYIGETGRPGERAGEHLGEVIDRMREDDGKKPTEKVGKLLAAVENGDSIGYILLPFHLGSSGSRILEDCLIKGIGFNKLTNIHRGHHEGFLKNHERETLGVYLWKIIYDIIYAKYMPPI